MISMEFLGLQLVVGVFGSEINREVEVEVGFLAL